MVETFVGDRVVSEWVLRRYGVSVEFYKVLIILLLPIVSTLGVLTVCGSRFWTTIRPGVASLR